MLEQGWMVHVVSLGISPLSLSHKYVEMLTLGRAMKKKLEDGGEQPPPATTDRIENSFTCKIDAVEGAQCPFEAIFEQVATGIAYVALSGQLLRVNLYICNMTGYEREELLQCSLFDFTPEEDLHVIRTFFERC